jgi:DNA repair protein SbcD/Mre11
MFLHLSDTHLGFSDFNKVDSISGLNQREIDIYNVFKWIVDYSLKVKPKFIIHAGDLFDTPRPPNRTISFTLSQLKKLSEAKIPIILISGNHSTPRMSISGSIFESFKVFPYVYPIYKGKYEQVKIDNFIIHCIPHCSTELSMKNNIKKVKINKSYQNILTTHAGISGDKSYETGEFNEQKIPLSILKNNLFDYIALGHYHHFKKVSSNAYFSSATERFSFKFAGVETGFLKVNPPTYKVEFIKTPSRVMESHKIEVQGLTANQIHLSLKKIADKTIKNSVVLINIENIKREVWLALDRKAIEEKFKKAFVLELRPIFFQKEGKYSGKTHIDDLPIEFDYFIKKLKKPKQEKDLFKKLGIIYLQQAQRESL